MARPRKYGVKALDEAVERYFASISRVVVATEMKPTGQRDTKGHMIYEPEPIINALGEELMVEEFIVPPTVGGLCQFLGIHRSTWAEYCDKDLHPEFSDTTTRARGRMRAYLEQQLLTRKDVRGVIFDLQNNHGYAEKRQVELGERASRAVGSAGMTMAEKKELLEKIARDYGGGDHGETTADG